MCLYLCMFIVMLLLLDALHLWRQAFTYSSTTPRSGRDTFFYLRTSSFVFSTIVRSYVIQGQVVARRYYNCHVTITYELPCHLVTIVIVTVTYELPCHLVTIVIVTVTYELPCHLVTIVIVTVTYELPCHLVTIVIMTVASCN